MTMRRIAILAIVLSASLARAQSHPIGGTPINAGNTAQALATTGAAVNVGNAAPPSGSGKACITTDATHCTWQTAGGGGGTPGGADTQVQFNNSGAFGADAALTWLPLSNGAGGLTIKGVFSGNQGLTLWNTDTDGDGQFVLDVRNDDGFAPAVRIRQLGDGGMGLRVIESGALDSASYGAFISSTSNIGLRVDGGIYHGPTTPPTCNAAHSGLQIFVRGGAGVADIAEICAKSSLDAYAWYPMATIP